MYRLTIVLTTVCLCLCATNLLPAQNRNSILITEIMSDPSPTIGLPNVEWIEIRNVSATNINLQNWRLGDATSLSGAFPSFNLQPDSILILCSTGSLASMQTFGRCLAIPSFPSLDNTGELIYLRNQFGATIHAVDYKNAWFNNAVKADGGWSLEMIDPTNPCSGNSNWKASINPTGGTPGKINSVNGTNTDQAPPQLINAYAIDSITAILYFDEPLDSATAIIPNNYTLSDGISVNNVICLPPLLNTVQLKLNTALIAQKIIQVKANNLQDCAGNLIGGFNTSILGFNSPADTNDIIINEILFNPKADGTDYIELYNRSKKIIALSSLVIANRNSSGALANLKPFTTQNRSLFPGEYLVLSEDATLVTKHYNTKNRNAFLDLASMPSFPDDQGNIVILNNQGVVIDELAYTDKMHFALITNTEGVALERIDPNSNTQDPHNWHSAAKDVGYGTPTYQNSQFRIDVQVQGEITLTPERFSPDNDGTDDVLTITYQFPENGYMMNCTVFDAAGRPVKALQRNALCSQSGTFRWDGLNDQFQALPTGAYILFTEVFNLTGKVKRFKNQLVLGRRF